MESTTGSRNEIDAGAGHALPTGTALADTRREDAGRDTRDGLTDGNYLFSLDAGRPVAGHAVPQPTQD